MVNYDYVTVSLWVCQPEELFMQPAVNFSLNAHVLCSCGNSSKHGLSQKYCSQ